MNPQHTDVDDPKDTNVADPKDTNTDDGDVTPADTDGNKKPEDDPKNDDAKQVADKQEKRWLDDINSGKKSIDDMPENLGWLKDRVKKKLEPKPTDKKEVKDEDIDSRVDKRLQEREAQDDYDDLVDDLKAAEITAEQDAQLKEEYEYQLAGNENPTPSQKFKALNTARRIVGIKSVSEHSKARRRRGGALMPQGTKKRETTRKDDETVMEKKLGGNLPPGYGPKK